MCRRRSAIGCDVVILCVANRSTLIAVEAASSPFLTIQAVSILTGLGFFVPIRSRSWHSIWHTVKLRKLADCELQEPLFNPFLLGVLFKYETKFQWPIRIHLLRNVMVKKNLQESKSRCKIVCTLRLETLLKKSGEVHQLMNHPPHQLANLDGIYLCELVYLSLVKNGTVKW